MLQRGYTPQQALTYAQDYQGIEQPLGSPSSSNAASFTPLAAGDFATPSIDVNGLVSDVAGLQLDISPETLRSNDEVASLNAVQAAGTSIPFSPDLPSMDGALMFGAKGPDGKFSLPSDNQVARGMAAAEQSRRDALYQMTGGAEMSATVSQWTYDPVGAALGATVGDIAALGTSLFRDDGLTVNPFTGRELTPEEFFNAKFDLLTICAAEATAALRVAGNLPETVSVFRKMSAAEAAETLETLSLQTPIAGANSSKYLSESLSKVEAFQNRGVAADTRQEVLEFVLKRDGYQDLMASSVNQVGSRGVDAVKYNFEGISDPALRNIGVPASKLEEFNNLILKIKKLSNP
ncbi:hypothetical protein [Solimonas marina]|uniref:Uncharacterized protein n=1 Tax=Solimonas marina TaxID=2714601 RepID=A0A969W7D5_9GAMM|nr:hypothetical protein [Solimonas marina]NKF21313.1 hypothetical protein [Solimonas marina]